MIRTITVTNHTGDSIVMDLFHPEKSGFAIKSITGLGPAEATINTTDVATNDGSLFNSARLTKRNIVFSLIFLPKDSIEDTRQASYKYFPPKKNITILIETDNRSLQTTGYVETNEPSIFEKQEGAEISVICLDPYFYATGSDSITTTVFSDITPTFEFPFSNESTSEDLIVMADITTNTEKVVYYSGDGDIGFTITIHAIGEVTNITIYNMDTRESMFIDTDKLEALTGSGVVYGDDIVICTVKNQKSATLLRNGVSTNILNCISKDSTWFQLTKGDNQFAYTAETYPENLEFTVTNQVIYEGI